MVSICERWEWTEQGRAFLVFFVTFSVKNEKWKEAQDVLNGAERAFKMLEDFIKSKRFTSMIKWLHETLVTLYYKHSILISERNVLVSHSVFQSKNVVLNCCWQLPLSQQDKVSPNYLENIPI